MKLSHPFFSQLLTAFRHLSLPRQFFFAGGLVMLLGILVIGDWVAKKIEAGVTENAGITTAFLMDSLVAPLAQELHENDSLSINSTRALENMLDSPALEQRVQSIKIWKKNGLIAYSNNVELIGKVIRPTERLLSAWSGAVVSELDGLVDGENKNEREKDKPLLEIYSPIRSHKTGEVIAVAEFYENAGGLKRSLDNARHQSWLVVALTMVAIGLSLLMIVLGANSTIEQQRIALSDRVRELDEASDQNNTLKERVMRASARSAEINEQYLRQISSDLHDGPAQLLGLASLRLDGLREPCSTNQRLRDISAIGSALDDAMLDIRNICKGITLPEIETQTLEELIEGVVELHEIRTGTRVVINEQGGVHQIPTSSKICAYRFIQEGLNNAFKHAGGLNQCVSYSVGNNVLELTVSNMLGKKTDSTKTHVNYGLGLSGLRDRVEALGGEFTFIVKPQSRVVLSMVVRI